jgi:hypothetical protein
VLVLFLLLKTFIGFILRFKAFKSLKGKIVPRKELNAKMTPLNVPEWHSNIIVVYVYTNIYNIYVGDFVHAFYRIVGVLHINYLNNFGVK